MMLRSMLKLQSNLVHMSWALNLFKLGTAMTGVFIPFIVLQNGGNLLDVAVFYLVYAVVKLATNYSAMRIIGSAGAHVGIGFGFAFGALQLVVVLGYSLSQSGWLLFAGAICLALTNAFLWNAQHLFISRMMDDATKSSSVATMEIIGKVFGMFGPLVGGVIGSLLGLGWLLAIAILIIFIAFIPLYRTQRLGKIVEMDQLQYRLAGAPLRDLVANFSFNVETTIGVMFWPIYLAVFIGSYHSIGAVTALAVFAAVITTWVAGYRGDKGSDRAVLREGAVSISLINILRLFATGTFGITAVSVFYQSALAYLQNSWVSTYYHHAKKYGPQYIVSMEIACDLAYLFVWGVLSLLLVVSSNESLFFNAAFLLAAVAAFGTLLIHRQVAKKAS